MEKKYPYVAVGHNGTKVLFVKKNTGIVIEKSEKAETAMFFTVGKYMTGYDEDVYFTPLSTLVVVSTQN